MKVFDYIQTDNKFHLVTELSEGGDVFDKVLKKKRLNEEEAADIMKQLFESLKYLHQKRVIHRDLKPEHLVYLDQD